MTVGYRFRRWWKQLWCLHYWHRTPDRRFIDYRMEEWYCLTCCRVVVTPKDNPPVSARFE